MERVRERVKTFIGLLSDFCALFRVRERVNSSP